MGIEVDYVRDSSADLARFAALLQRDREQWLPNWLSKASNNPEVRVGMESEICAFTDTLEPAFHQGSALLAALEDRSLPFVPELVQCVLECVSPEYRIAGNGFAKLRSDMTAWQSIAQETAADMNAAVGLFGTAPWPARYFRQDRSRIMTDRTRYQIYSDRMPPWWLSLPGSDDPAIVELENVLGVGSFGSCQVSMDVPANQLHRYSNAAKIASSLLRAWFPNGDAPFGIEVTPHDMRMESFDRATIINDDHRTFIGHRWATSPISVFDECIDQVQGHSVFLDASKEERGSALKRLLSCTFPIVRPRFGSRNNLYLEIRILSAGPTIRQQVSAAAVTVGLIRALVDEIDDWMEYSYERIRENFTASAYGLDSRLGWLHEGRFRQDSARNIAGLMMPKIRHALIELLRADEDVVDHALLPAQLTLDTGVTAASWLKDVRRELRTTKPKLSEPDVLRESTRHYLEVSEHGTSNTPVGLWDAKLVTV